MDQDREKKKQGRTQILRVLGAAFRSLTGHHIVLLVSSALAFGARPSSHLLVEVYTG